MKLAYGDFLPDLPDYASPGVSEALNVYPGPAGYRPVGQFLAHTEAPLPGVCKGSAAFIAPSGRVVLLAGTDDKLYRLDGTSFVEISSGYSVPLHGRWRFVQYGPIAVVSNAFDPPVRVDLETDAVVPLGGSPPIMQAMAVVGDFLVGTQIDGDVNTIAWSGENDAEWWTYSQHKSDYQPFPDGGEVTGVIGGGVGLILQRNAVRRMAYVGGNILFRFDKISSNIGCASVHTVAQFGELAFWYSDSGFKMWDGAQIRPIGQDRVDSSFSRLYEVVNLHEVSTAVDGQRSTVCWSTGQRMWLYNWLLDKWTIVEQAAEIVTQRPTKPPSLEEQDPVIGAPDDELDADGLPSFDSGRYRSGDPVFYVFTGGALGTFNGANMAARITGRTLELIEGRDARVRRIRPLTDAISGMTIRVATKQRLGDEPVRKDFATLQASGEMPTRARGRFVKARLSIAADVDWTYLQGIDATLEVGGKR